MNVLLIEDNEDDAELIKEALAEQRDQPFELDWVARLDTGLEKLTQGPVDAILVDLSLPDSQGLETVDRVLARFHDAPVVVLTGLDDEAVAEGALRRGAQDYLVKGRLDADTLKRAIRYAVGRNSVEQALRKSEERFQLACRATSDGIWDWDIDADELWWNDTFEAVFGHQENTGRGAVVWSERIHPDERAAIVTTLTSVVHSERNLWTAEYRFLRTDGTYAHVLDRGYVLRDQHGTARRMIGAMTDITEQKQAEIQRAAHLAVTLALDESVTLGEAVPKILRAICELKGWALGAMWLINAHRKVLQCDAIWHTACPDTEEFAASYRALTLQLESGLAGTVWKLGQPYLVPNVLKDPAFPALHEAERAGLRGAIAFP
ncbi:MAG: response regulator, partial [Nitrospiraceae bacterium]